ncbi:MAG: precorrin-6y C5,15-methyltransferase (decarboxylating) subunit CbiE [Paracoccaceae bacterium]|jgi:precorrin-6Y C5,15-methyltransferase (decarboxylating)|nr:precorrin-6y C5,15-methyltransferase (decarboxylating) subunit CbiE [Paracoccaceae bacterium]MDP7186949.1 precorrin-6y C5,15-methyltransferase (decarboxylating) subunit CbiE [Paracoccaceae bacterium]
MSETPWLSIIGLGEDGPEGLSPASRNALEAAEIIMGPQRHLDLLGRIEAKAITWPVPFSDGVEKLLSFRGRNVAMLVSGDPFWFGAGSTIEKHLEPFEWTAHPNVSTFSLAASRLGWSLQDTTCLGLHAAPVQALRASLANGQKAIVLLRDGAAVTTLANYLKEQGFGETRIHILEALNGTRERMRSVLASDVMPDDIQHPVCLGVEISGTGDSLPLSSGRPDSWFEHDGQITKQPVRAITLSALAPTAGEYLWDIGGGSGSISVEWCLSHPKNRATVIETRADRADRIQQNARKFGLSGIRVVQTKAPEGLADLDLPDAVFIGGGLSDDLLETLTQHLPAKTRIVANSVTLESDALLTRWQEKLGGDLIRLELSSLSRIGPRRGWKAAYPLVQWSVKL